ncbi:MAG: threonine--tRNA ligase [Patescibacteria group bacterium]
MPKVDANLDKLRHTTAHVTAAAVLELFPNAKFGIGPVIKDGFYYDFELPRSLNPQDLPKVEAKMKEIIKRNLPLEKVEVKPDQAVKINQEAKQVYKLELIDELIQAKEQITVYKCGRFNDLCRGPHLTKTGLIKPETFKLLGIAGAYWKGDEKRPMLQRIYGTVWQNKADLDIYLKRIQEAESRNHRILGKQLDLYSIQEKAGAGLVFWHPNGALIRHQIETFWKDEHFKQGYQLLYTPHIAKLDIWKKSGHWEKFRENMFSPMQIDNIPYEIKPMNCPFHIMIYQTKKWSYKELPLRWGELGTVYRYEPSGTLHGLTRVRGFTQDDAHIFCTEEQFAKEVEETVKLANYMMKVFGLKPKHYLATRPEKFLGKKETWDFAEGILEKVLKKLKLEYEVDKGGGVFYGPKIDVKVTDALMREWQGPTIQLDFNLPERFNVTYVDKGGQNKKVIMIHRTVLGSMERFLGSLIEHYGGNFPAWLAPVQVQIMPVGSKHIKPSQKLGEELKKEGFRVYVDDLNETVGYKIRKAIQQKVPYMLVIGDKEVKQTKLAVRERGKKVVKNIAKKTFIKQLHEEIAKKKIK